MGNLKIVTKRKKRVGRGYGSGKGGHTTGRGQKGQKSRGKVGVIFEGYKVRKSFIKRLPFRRGKGRFEAKAKPLIINLKHLEVFPENSVVNIESLVKHGIVDGKDFDQIIRDFNDDRYTIESKSAPADTLKSRVGEPTVTAVTPIITTEASGLENISLGIGVKNTGLRGNVDYKNLGVELGARIKQEVPTQPLYFLGRGSLPLGDYSRLGTKVGIVVENTDTHPRDLGDKKTNPVLVGYIRVGPSDGAGVEFELGRVFDGKDSYNLIGAGLTYDLGGSNPQSKGLSSTQMREVEEATRPDSLDALTGKTSDTNEPIIHPITGEVLPSIAGMYDMNGDGRITSNDAELLATIFPNHPRYDIVHYGEIGGQKLNKYDFWEGLLRDNLDVYRDGTSIEDRIFVEGFDDYRTNVRTNLSISERGG